MANLRIDIASEFTGRKAFQDAGNATNALDKSVSKLGKTMASAFSVYKIAQFSKDTIKAFADDQKAASLLANELKNLGLALSTQDVERFIQKMQQQTGILDDELRPAYSQLIRVLGSTVETQKAMATAFDVSSGTGKSFQEVVNALSQAYVGNVKGLKSLNLGLTQAELKTKTYSQIIDILNKKFAGAGAASLDTYAGKMALLNVALSDAKETIGAGFLDAFTLIANDSDFKNVTEEIGNMADGVANALVGVGTILDTIRNKFDAMPSWIKNIFQSKAVQGVLNPSGQIYSALSAIGSKTKVSQAMPSGITNFLSEQQQKSKLAAEGKAARDAAARAKTLADLIKKQTAAQDALNKKKKEAAALDELSKKYKVAEGIFDMEQIQIMAAMMQKQSAEDYARLQLKRDLFLLQQAIDAGNVAEATRLAAIVEQDYKRVQAYQAINIAAGIQAGIITNIQAAATLIPKDMKLIDLENLDAALKAILAIIDALSKIQMPAFGGGGGGGGGGKKVVKKAPVGLVNPDGTLTPKGLVNLPPTEETAMETFLRNYEGAIGTIDKNNAALKAAMDSGFFGLTYNASEFLGTNINPYQMTDAQAKAYSQGQLYVTVNNNTNGLAEVIMSTTQDQSANGNYTRIDRNTGSLNW